MPCKKILIPILFLIIGSGCKDKITNPGPESLFYPLKVGNTWEYEFKQYDSLGILELEGTFEEKIIADTFLNYQLMYEVESPLYPDRGCCIVYSYFVNKYDGLHLLIFAGITEMYNDRIYKFPTTKDDFFISTDRNHDTTFVISIEDTIVTEAGIFSCFVYKNKIKLYAPEDSLLGYVYTYIANGVGKI